MTGKHDNIIDVVMLSFTKDRNYFDMTHRAIKTLHDSELHYKFNVHLVETNPEYSVIGTYEGCKNIITPKEKFNYNRFLNIGLSYCYSDLVVIANNDLLFAKGWFTNIATGMDLYKLDSASPQCPEWTKRKNIRYFAGSVECGYRVGYHFFGHLLVIRKSVFKKIGKFDERFAFWYQDDDFAKQLEGHRLKHGIVKTSLVTHLFSRSHDLLENKGSYTYGMVRVFNDKYKK